MRTMKLWMLAVVGTALSVSAVTAEDEPGDKALAWIRFENAPEQYSGKPYLWLGDRRIELAVDVKPAAEHVLYLLWGSKNDARTAKVVVNGKSQTVEGGGYDGFRWMKVTLPGDLTGDNYQISIRQTGGEAAFLAEVRLIAPAGKRDEADICLHVKLIGAITINIRHKVGFLKITLTKKICHLMIQLLNLISEEINLVAFIPCWRIIHHISLQLILIKRTGKNLL